MQVDQKVSKSDIAVRLALLKCNNYKCVLTGEPILDDFDVDHIIPVALRKEPAKLQEYLASLGLPETFELDSLLNLIPVKRKRNRKKSNTLLNKGYALFLLDCASQVAPRVIEETRKFKQLMTVGQAKEVIRGYLAENGTESEDFVEHLYNTLLDDDEPFAEERDRWDVEGDCYFFISKTSVRLEARLPTLKHPSGLCRIEFRSLKARNARLTVKHADIVHVLCRGLYTAPQHGLRTFLSDGLRKDGGGHVYLGNSRVPLKVAELTQLCEIVDEFGSEYLNALTTLETLTRCQGFKRSRLLERGYRIVKVPRILWDRMVEFGMHHDVDEGHTSWNIFDTNNNHIKVFTRNANSRLDAGFHMFFHPEPDDDAYPWSLRRPDEAVWVVAEVLTPYLWREHREVGERGIWDAHVGYMWLTEEFIPKVITEMDSSTRKNLRRKVPVFESGMQDICLTPDSLRSAGELRSFVEYLQCHWHLVEGSYLTTEDVRGLYSAIGLCLQRSTVKDYPYIRKNLPFEVDDTSPRAILESILTHAKSDEGGVFPTLAVDCSLRCLVVALRDGRTSLTLTEVERIAVWLAPLYVILMREELLERASPNYRYEADGWYQRASEKDNQSSQEATDR